MEVLTPGGLAKPMRSTTTGEALGLGFRNAPVASSATAQTPNTTVTATRTTSSGECGRGARAHPALCFSVTLIREKESLKGAGIIR